MIDFVSKVFIIKVTVRGKSLQLKPSKRLVATIVNPEKIFILDSRQYITLAIKRDKVSILSSFNFIKVFSDVPQESVLAIWEKFLP